MTVTGNDHWWFVVCDRCKSSTRLVPAHRVKEMATYLGVDEDRIARAFARADNFVQVVEGNNLFEDVCERCHG